MKRIVAIMLALVCLLSIVASADGTYRPSIEYKDVTITTREDPDDPTKKYVADIKIGDEAGGTEKLLESVEEGYLFVTPYGKKDEAHTEEVKERLEAAFEEVTSVKTVADLNPELEVIAQEINPEYTARNLVVSDLFDIDLSDYYSDVLSEDGAYISITFEVQGSDNDPVAAVLYEEDGQWMIARIVNTVDNGDGTMTVVVEFEKLSGPVVLLKATSEEHIVAKCCECCPGWCPFCPSPCDKMGVCLCWIVPQLIVLAVVVLLVCLFAGKKKNDEEENPAETPEN